MVERLKWLLGVILESEALPTRFEMEVQKYARQLVVTERKINGEPVRSNREGSLAESA